MYKNIQAKKGIEPLLPDYEPSELTVTLFYFRHKCFHLMGLEPTILKLNYQYVLLLTLLPEVSVTYTI